MQNTLHYFCKALGWQGGTIHQARERFAVASIQEMDKICGVLVDNSRDISDLREVQYFLAKRNDAHGLHIRALNATKSLSY